MPKTPEPLELQDSISSVPSPSTHTPPAASVAPSPNITAPVETPPPYHEIYPGQTQPSATANPPAAKGPQGFTGQRVPVDQLSLLVGSASPPSTQNPHNPPGLQSNTSPMDPAGLSTQSDPLSSPGPSSSAGPSDPQHPSAGRPKVEDAGPLPRKMRTFQD